MGFIRISLLIKPILIYTDEEFAAVNFIILMRVLIHTLHL